MQQQNHREDDTIGTEYKK